MEIHKILDACGLQYRMSSSDQFVVKICPFCPDTKGRADNLWKFNIGKQNGLFICHRCREKGNANQLLARLHDRDMSSRYVMTDRYIYHDENGQACLRVTRLENNLGQKKFFQEHLVSGLWAPGKNQDLLQPFKFDDWQHSNVIIIVEGEKCALSLTELGLPTTTFAGGSNGWKEHYAKYFQNRHAILLPDNDEVGFAFIASVAENIAKFVASYKIVLLPNLKEKEDVVDWLEAGGTLEQFKRICDETEANSLHMLRGNFENISGCGWGEFRELPSIHHAVDDVDANLIPESIRDWVCDIADRMQVPLVSVSVLAFTMFGSVIGRQARIFPKREDDWYEVANLWSMIIMPSGRLKSPIINSILRPLEVIAQQEAEKFGAAEKIALLNRSLVEAQIQTLKKDMQKFASSIKDDSLKELSSKQSEFLRLQDELEKSLPSAKRFKIHDATVEKIGELLKSNPNGMLLVRDELSGWLSSLDRHGHESDRAFFLEAWNGKGSYDVDRILRGTIHIPALCLSILGGIPPSKIESYIESAVADSVGNDGLLQRFSLMVYADFKKDWRLVDRAPNLQAYDKICRMLSHLVNLAPSTTTPREFRFSPDAQELFYDWLCKLEKSIRVDEFECEAFISHVSKYRKLVPALSLQFFLLKSFADDSSTKIDVESTSLAIAWTRILEAHARRVYSLALKPQIHSARALAQKIMQGKVFDGMRLREIYRHQWSNIKNRTQVDTAIAVLIECGWATVEEMRPACGAPYEVLKLRPELIAKGGKNTFATTDRIASRGSVSCGNDVEDGAKL